VCTNIVIYTTASPRFEDLQDTSLPPAVDDAAMSYATTLSPSPVAEGMRVSFKKLSVFLQGPHSPLVLLF
jgi:hypothetical protein